MPASTPTLPLPRPLASGAPWLSRLAFSSTFALQVEHVKTEKKILEEIDHLNIVNMLGAFQDDKRAAPPPPPPRTCLASAPHGPLHTHHTAHGRNLYLLLEYIIGGEFFSHLRKAKYKPRAQPLAQMQPQHLSPPPPISN